jgi:uncharacterized protein
MAWSHVRRRVRRESDELRGSVNREAIGERMAINGKTGKNMGWCWLGVMSLLMAAPAWAGPAEDTEQAEKEFAKGNLVGAMGLWKKAAEAGHAPAQVWLGDILDKAEEDEFAVVWYRKAAEQGDAGGEFGLGQMYAKGEGVKKDFEQAVTYIRRAAEKNYLNAAVVMRDIYKSGSFGVTVDLAQSEIWDVRVKEILGKDHPSLVVAPPPEPTGKKKKKR